MVIVQFVRMSGVAVEGARWEVNSSENLRTGDSIQFSFNIKEDTNLISYIAKRSNMDCVVERVETPNDPERFQYSIILTGIVKSLRHMIDTSTTPLDGKHLIESMVTVVPINRTIENVITYILDHEKCDRKFVALLEQTN